MDPVPRAMMVQEYPRVCRWAERLHEGDLGDGDWLLDDFIPSTLFPILQVFFTEMWPVLKSTCKIVTDYCHGCSRMALPGKSFSPAHPDQIGNGPLVHDFLLPFGPLGEENGQTRGRRMVVPYQLWMLQRLEATVSKP